MAITDAELEQMAEHVRYEVDEFRKAIQKLANLRRGDTDWNNTIESVLLHFRNLRAFFFGPRFKQDVLAEDYVANWNPTNNSVFQSTKDNIVLLPSKTGHLI